MKDQNFRNMEKAPVPLHAIDTVLVEAMHGELVILYRLANVSSKGLRVLYRQSFEKDLQAGHLWDYDADRVRAMILDVYAERVSASAALALLEKFTPVKEE